MIHRINRKLFNIFALDIETHNDEESIAKNETSMWLGCFINEENKATDESSYFYSWKELLARLDYLTKTHRKRVEGKLEKRTPKNVAIYIYNLSFEWSFLLPYLEENGFKSLATISEEDEYCFSSISTKSVSSVWEVRIKLGKKQGIILLRDLAKMYSGGLANVAKSFGLPTQKGEIDYRLNRLHGHVITPEEKEYCFKDTRIIIDVLLKQIELEDKDFFNSISMASYSTKQLLKNAYPRSLFPYKKFREEYPALSEEETEFVRKGFAGGLCYATESYQFKELTDIGHIDAKQMYPSMIFLHPHPYGEGTYFKGKPTNIFKCANMCHVKISYSNAKLHSVISLIGLPFIEERELYLWDFEIPTMYKIYEDLEIEYIDGYCYKTKFLPWRNYVKSNFEKREQAKAKGDKYNVMRYKLLNNAGAYGKFVERPHNEIFLNYINEDGIIDSLIESKKERKILAKYTYIPLCSITARARVCLIETALKFGIENVCYFDTDSIFFKWNKKTEKVLYTQINLNNELGGWALEEINQQAQFTASKRYKTKHDGISTIKAGGINFDNYKEKKNRSLIESLMLNKGYTLRQALNEIDLPYDEINIISSIWEVQRAYRCKGGTLIKFQTKEMSVAKKYLPIYEKNIYNNED